MITFVIKSTMCLTILYGFYHLFLRNIKVFNFNRYYLLFSLLFALIVPFIIIPLTLNLPFSIILFKDSSLSTFPTNSNEIMDDKINLYMLFKYISNKLNNNMHFLAIKLAKKVYNKAKETPKYVFSIKISLMQTTCTVAHILHKNSVN